MGTVRHVLAIAVQASALMAVAGTTVAQAPTAQQQPHAGFATITGIVVDSMRGGPLVGAAVTVDGSLRSAISDSAGRFHIDSLEAGQLRIGVFHPLLDSLGFGISSPLLTVKAGDTLRLVLATPSAPTVVGRFCRNAAPAADGQTGPVLLVGRILDADTDEPVAHIHVSVSWVRRQLSVIGLHRVLITRDTTTVANGVFHFCQLPPGLKLVVRATRNAVGDTTAANELFDRQYDMGNQLVGVVALHVPGVTVASAPSASPGVATVTGRVTHADGTPAVAVRVAIVGAADSALTGDSGRFVLHRLRPGTRTLVLRAIGFEPVTASVEVSGQQTRNVNLALGVKIAVLDSIRVVGQLKNGYQRVGFDRRRQSGTGHYLTAEDIAKLQATLFHELFTSIPGVAVAYGSDGVASLTGTRGGGGCVSYFVDGSPYNEMFPGDIDTYLHPQEVAAIEVYSPSQAPAQYLVYGPNSPPVGPAARSTGRQGVTTAPSSAPASKTPSPGGCTVVVVWTKPLFGL